VPTIAPRIPAELIEILLRLDDRNRPIAETYRQLGAEADRLGLTRPSYERVRELVHELREGSPRLTPLQVLMLLTTMPKGVEDGLRRMDLLGMKGIADWAGVHDPRRALK
jgi:hypothetical protein